MLQLDGYAGYRALAKTGSVRLAFRWANVRRRFYELAAADAAPIATEALARIAALYTIEADIRGRHPDERRRVRQDRSRPIVDAFEPCLRDKGPIALNRKNSLFAGSDGGAEHWATIASLNAVDPQAYLADVLTRIVNGHPNSASTTCCHGTTSPRQPSKPWPEEDAYRPSSTLQLLTFSLRRKTAPSSMARR